MEDVELIRFKKNWSSRELRGFLVAAEGMIDIPFPVKRVFWIYGVPESAIRGGHAHILCEQVIIAVHGSFELETIRKTYAMEKPTIGAYIPPGVSVTMRNFTTDAVCLVLASEYYDPMDYIYDNEESNVLGFETPVETAFAVG